MRKYATYKYDTNMITKNTLIKDRSDWNILPYIRKLLSDNYFDIIAITDIWITEIDITSSNLPTSDTYDLLLYNIGATHQ